VHFGGVGGGQGFVEVTHFPFWQKVLPQVELPSGQIAHGGSGHCESLVHCTVGGGHEG
jgi:hypothetical protein